MFAKQMIREVIEETCIIAWVHILFFHINYTAANDSFISWHLLTSAKKYVLNTLNGIGNIF